MNLGPFRASDESRLDRLERDVKALKKEIGEPEGVYKTVRYGIGIVSLTLVAIMLLLPHCPKEERDPTREEQCHSMCEGAVQRFDGANQVCICE